MRTFTNIFGEEMQLISAMSPTSGKIYNVAVLKDAPPEAVRDAERQLQNKIKDDMEGRITLVGGKDDDIIAHLIRLGVKVNIKTWKNTQT